MKYDYDNLHIEIDNAAAELKLDVWDALEIWHMGIEAFQKQRTEQGNSPDANSEVPFCGYCNKHHYGYEDHFLG